MARLFKSDKIDDNSSFTDNSKQDKWREKHKEHYMKNKDKTYARHVKWQKDNREKVKAHRYNNNHNQIRDSCGICNVFNQLNKSYGVNVSRFLGDESHLDFHHTNYEVKEGITLYRMHHLEVHKRWGVT